MNDIIQIGIFFSRPKLTKVELNHLYIGIATSVIAIVLAYILLVYARKWTKYKQ